ncbi:MAG: aminoacyl-tRNA hydrolase [SAR202 cluster bacterium Io17-Chloro-G9]|nr:MAG: aminoacyl-tRNA hydrolase [SAR202 cluster bacterium Io17-Chloro-G9]
MRIIVGLGNPGDRHRDSRHNLGFRCVDLMSRRWEIPFSERRAKANLAIGRRSGRDVVLVKPRTFMNNSGEGVSYLIDRFGVRPSDILIIYDDLELALGRIRLRTQGTGGTHNGMRSIISVLQTQEIPRLRVGIGHPPLGQDTVPYVLGRFSEDESESVSRSVGLAADAVECILEENIDAAMNRFNSVQTEC